MVAESGFSAPEMNGQSQLLGSLESRVPGLSSLFGTGFQG